MYEVHAFFAEGEATKAMEPEYEAGERYVLIVFCRRPRYSVHDFKLVEEVADEVLILNEGTILKHDTVENVKREAEAPTLDEALRKLIFPETEHELRDYFAHETKSEVAS